MEKRSKHGVSVVLTKQSLPPLALLGNILNSTEFAVVATGSRVSALRVIPAVTAIPRPCALKAQSTCVIAGGSKVCDATPHCGCFALLVLLPKS